MITTTPKPTVKSEWIGTNDKPAATTAPRIIPTICALHASQDCLNVFSIADIAPSIANTILDVELDVPNIDTTIKEIITAIADLKVLRPI